MFVRTNGPELKQIVTDARKSVVNAEDRISKQMQGIPFVPNSGTHVVSASISLAVAQGHLAEADLFVPGKSVGFIIGRVFPAHLNVYQAKHVLSGALGSARAGEKLVRQADAILDTMPGTINDTPSPTDLAKVDSLLRAAIVKFDKSLQQAG